MERLRERQNDYGEVDLDKVGGDDLLREMIRRLEVHTEVLFDIAETNRYSRGGYDGPFLRGKSYGYAPAPGGGQRSPLVTLFSGRGAPTALLITGDGTGVGTDRLFISDDKGQISGGYTVGLTGPFQLRIIADRDQILYSAVDFTGAVLATTVNVREGRL